MRRFTWLLLAIPLVIGLARLQFDVEVLNLLPDDSPAVHGLRLYHENFSDARELVITIQHPDADLAQEHSEQLATHLRALPSLVKNVTWQPPWTEHPDQSGELIAYLWLNQPPHLFAQLTNRLATPHIILEETRQLLATSFSPSELGRLSYDPFQLSALPSSLDQGALAFGTDQSLFQSDDGTFRLVFIEAAIDLSSYRTCIRWLRELDSAIADWRRTQSIPDSLVIHYAGRPAFVAEIAGGMERDILLSVAGTIGLIALLFWIAHRSWKPLLWLVTLLVLILTSTFAMGGLFFGTLNVVSAGFAAILLGLSVDYAMVLYQEHRSAPTEPIHSIRRTMGPGIFWSVFTTGSAFAVLNWGGLPGLGELGSLVAIGIALAGFIMFRFFLPPLAGLKATAAPRPSIASHPLGWIDRPAFILAFTSLSLAGFIAAAVHFGFPLDASTKALRLRNSPAYTAVEEIKTRMNRTQEPLWLIVGGTNELDVGRRLDAVHHVLKSAASNQSITSFTLPNTLWPRPDFQEANRPALQRLLQQQETLFEQAQTHGFTRDSLPLTDSIFKTWRRALTLPAPFWPDNSISDWIFKKLTARNGQLLALGLVYPAPAASSDSPASELARITTWTRQLPDSVWVAGWGQLGSTLLARVQKNLAGVLGAIVTLILLSLWLAFRRWTEVFLSFATLAFSLLGLWTIMVLVGWNWNVLNLTALPLLLGAGVDYSLHIQMSLRRHGGDARATRSVVGRALFLCAATTFIGFGSLSWSSNAGLASLGQICATGIALVAFTAVILLPGWWTALMKMTGSSVLPRPPGFPAPASPDLPFEPTPPGPSKLYRSAAWSCGLAAARSLPSNWVRRLASTIATCYCWLNPRRRKIVFKNILPVVSGDPLAAALHTRKTFRHFSRKLCDLWDYENGASIDHLILESTGWDHLHAARACGRGVLLVTPHIGNWEFGAPLLAQKGIPLLVITQEEPQSKLTRMRSEARRRWGIETIVIGQNPFAFVDVIRRLESGATVALLIDRPAASSAVEIELFGQPFAASIAAAELARATGCAVVPVYLPRNENGYSAHVLPPLVYDQRQLGSREARRQFTQQMMRAFEPVIRLYVSQWYHFVPVWKPSEAIRKPACLSSAS